MNYENNLVSIIVPVYNVEKYLKKCIDSVLQQDYKNIELILVDDGSTDSSSNICDYYKTVDKRIVVIHKKNGGQSSARNVALDIFKGDYVGFVDSDDWIEPNAISAMLNAMLKHKADLCICAVGVQINDRIRYNPYDGSIKVVNKEQLMLDYVVEPFVKPIICNKLYRKEIFKTIRQPEGIIHEDVYMVHELLNECEKAVYVNLPLYIQYIRKNSTTQARFSERDFSLLDADQRIMDFYEKEYPAFYKYVSTKRINDIAVLMTRINVQSNHQIKKKFYSKLKSLLNDEYSIAERTYPKGINKITFWAKKHHFTFLIHCFFLRIKNLIKIILHR